MTIYIINIALVIVGAIIFLDRLRGDWAKKLYFFGTTLQLALVSGLRGYTVGPDTVGYAWLYRMASNMTLKNVLYSQTEMEKAYVLLEYGLSRISKNPTVLFFAIALFFMASVSRMIYRNSSEPCLSYVLFLTLGFFTFSMTGMRQTIALGILLFGFEFIKQRRLVMFLVTVGLASLFHFSALAFLPAYFLAYKKITKTYFLVAVVSIPAAFIFKGNIYEILRRVSGYDYAPFSNEGPYVLIALMITVLVGAFIQRESVIQRKSDNLVYYNMLLVSIIIGMLTFINPSALRVAYYYHIYLILFIPEVIFSISDRKLRRLIYGISIVAVIVLEVRRLDPSSPFVPYMFFWQ